MSLVVKNETADPYIFDRSAGRRRIDAGATEVISDEEWATVITAKRGEGELNPVWPTTELSGVQKFEFAYTLVGSDYKIEYFGTARQSTTMLADEWTIKRFSYTSVGTDYVIDEIQVLTNVCWNDRASLAWV